MHKFRSALAVLILISYLCAVAVTVPICHARTVTIEADIDENGIVTLDPNPAVVADGDIVCWHIREVPPGNWHFSLTFPEESNPLKDAPLMSGVYPAKHCHNIPSDKPGYEVEWPEGVTEYEYKAEASEAEASQSPALHNTQGQLVKQKPSVGGVIDPVDRFSLLAPHIGLASTIIVAIAATAIHVKRVKRRKER